jgi:hypothetical protein
VTCGSLNTISAYAAMDNKQEQIRTNRKPTGDTDKTKRSDKVRNINTGNARVL